MQIAVGTSKICDGQGAPYIKGSSWSLTPDWSWWWPFKSLGWMAMEVVRSKWKLNTRKHELVPSSTTSEGQRWVKTWRHCIWCEAATLNSKPNQIQRVGFDDNCKAMAPTWVMVDGGWRHMNLFILFHNIQNVSPSCFSCHFLTKNHLNKAIWDHFWVSNH